VRVRSGGAWRAVAAATTVGCLLVAPAAGAAGPSAVALRIDPAHTGSVDDLVLVPPLRPRWVRELDARDTYQPRISQPLIAGGRVFVVVVPSTTGVPVLHALSAATGATLWSRTLTGAGAGQPAYDAGRVFVTTYDDVRAFDAVTGDPLWTRSDVGPGGGAPVAAGGVVYTSSSWHAVALQASDGSTLWTRELFSAVYVTLGDQHVYYHGSKHTYALRRSDGAVVWEYWPGYDSFAGISMAPLVLHDGRLWFTDTVDATLLNAVAGTPAGTRDSTRMPAFWNGLAFVRADRGGRRCTGRIPVIVERRSGRRWQPVRRLLTRVDGRFKTRAPARQGRYRVRAPTLRLGDLTCRPARSPTARAGKLTAIA
jgi:hypothetical protein